MIITFHMHLAMQTGATPIMVAAMHNQYNIVSLLKNKYGQQEPTAEEMVSANIAIYSYCVSYAANQLHMHIRSYRYIAS